MNTQNVSVVFVCFFVEKYEACQHFNGTMSMAMTMVNEYRDQTWFFMH